MIILTGAAGFISSYLLAELNATGREDIVLVDAFTNTDGSACYPSKEANFKGKRYARLMNRKSFFTDFEKAPFPISAIIHLGAKTDTTLFDEAVFNELNVDFSKKMWHLAVAHQVPFIYASSAATYGNGEFGYKDDTSLINQLQPLNPYGWSKQQFDQWVLEQHVQPPFWAGLKFFNVYGPNEYHKGRMASVIFHAFKQIKEKGEVKLFRSHNPNYRDGEQLRDFVYVKDVASIILFLLEKQPASSIYNLGSGKARTFKALVEAIFSTLNLEPQIEYMDTPLDIRDKYQYFTEADMQKMWDAGYAKELHSLEAGVSDYVSHYLNQDFKTH